MAITVSGTTITFNDGTTQSTAAGAPVLRAYVNFNGTGSAGTNQTIRISSNVSSVGKTSTGIYTVNFASALPSTQYIMNYGAQAVNNNGNWIQIRYSNLPYTPSTTSCQISCGDHAQILDTFSAMLTFWN